MFASPRSLLSNHRTITEQEREFFANQWGKVKKKRKSSSRNKHYSFTVSCPTVFRYDAHRLQISSSKSRKEKMDKSKNKSLKEFVQEQNDALSDVSDSTQSVLSQCLTSQEASTQDSEVPPSNVPALKSNEGTLPARRVSLQNGDTQLGSRTDGDPGRKGKHGGGRELSKTSLAKPMKPTLKSKRRLLPSSPEPTPDDTVTVSLDIWLAIEPPTYLSLPK
jgi:hypothetical protein